LLVDGAKENEILELDNDWEHLKNMEIWDDEMCLIVLNGNQLLDYYDEAEKSRINKFILHYY
jgi:hypothetical protein